MKAAELLALDPVIPIATIDRIEDAVPLARALRNGGLHTLEVTLRTSVALEAIERIAAEVPSLVVGAGTVLSANQMAEARDAGAKFLVAPGSTAILLDGLERSGMPFLCGCSTASEVARLLERGINGMKLFPAEPIGGVELLKALSGPFPQACFCPTGGIDAELAPAYLELANVACVGGSWIARHEGGVPEWSDVADAAQAAARLRWTRR